MSVLKDKKTWVDWWRLLQLFRSVAPDDGSQRSRIRFMERNTVLPVKAVYFLVLIAYLYFDQWPEMDADRIRWTLLRTIQWFFVLCLIFAKIAFFFTKSETI